MERESAIIKRKNCLEYHFLPGVGSPDTRRHRLMICTPHLSGQPENRRRDFWNSIAKFLQIYSLVRISDHDPIEYICGSSTGNLEAPGCFCGEADAALGRFVRQQNYRRGDERSGEDDGLGAG
jgi:hypothetical protein